MNKALQSSRSPSRARVSPPSETQTPSQISDPLSSSPPLTQLPTFTPVLVLEGYLLDFQFFLPLEMSEAFYAKEP